MVPLNAAPRVLNRPHSISVGVEVPEAGAEGVLFSMGGNDGGFAFYVQNGLLTYGYNYVAEQFFHVRFNFVAPFNQKLFAHPAFGKQHARRKARMLGEGVLSSHLVEPQPKRIDQHQLLDPRRLNGRQLRRHPRANADPNDFDLGQPQRVQQVNVMQRQIERPRVNVG
jgi:hypothetical protein